MRAKQPTTSFTQTSLAQTILPSAENARGRKSRGAGTPVPPPAPPAQAWAPPPSPPAQVWSPPPSVPAPASAPDWGTPSASRFGSAPAAFASAPTSPQFGGATVTDYPVAPGFPPQPVLPGAPLGQSGYGRHGADRKGTKSRTPVLLVVALVVALAAGGYYEAPKLLDKKKSASSTTPLSKPPARASSTASSGTSGVKPGAGFTLPATLGAFPSSPTRHRCATAAAALKDGQATHVFEGTVVSAVYRQSPTTDVVVVGSANEDLNKDLKNLDDAVSNLLLPARSTPSKPPSRV